jgi:hypothetical protein
MGVGRRAKTLGEFASKAGLYAEVGIPQASRKSVEAAALFVTQAARASIAVGSGGDSALSNVGRGARVGARYDVRGDKNPTALVRATGPLHLLDNPTRAHEIRAKVTKGRSRASRSQFYNAIFGGSGGFASVRPMRTPYGPRYRVQHPGTRGKRTFFRAVDRTKAYVSKVYANEYAQQMRRFWS